MTDLVDDDAEDEDGCWDCEVDVGEHYVSTELGGGGLAARALAFWRSVSNDGLAGMMFDRWENGRAAGYIGTLGVPVMGFRL